MMPTLTYVVPAKPSRPFVVGDLVDVMDRDGRYVSTHRVVRVSKSTCRTDCRRTWMQKNGYASNKTVRRPLASGRDDTGQGERT